MTLKYNIADNGTNGNTITTSDTGTPAWDVAPVGTTGAMTYSNTGGCIRGSLCYAFSQGVTSAATYVGWNVNTGALNTTQYIRFYVDPADVSGTAIFSRGMTSSSGTQNWRLTVTGSTGVVTLRDSTNTIVVTSTGMSSGTRYRVEFYFDGGASAAYRLLYYVGESTTPTYDSGAGTANFGTTQHVRFGIASAQASVSCKIDDPAYSDTNALGPVVTTIAIGPSITSGFSVGNSPVTTNITVPITSSVSSKLTFGFPVLSGPLPQSVIPNSISSSNINGPVQFATLSVVAKSISNGNFGNAIITRNIVKPKIPSLTRSPVDRRDPGLGNRIPKPRRASTVPVFGVKFTASAEGGTNGATVGTSDTASGTAFNQSNTGSGATFTYSNTVNINGTLGYLATTGGSSVTAYRGWTTSGAAYQWQRIYFDSANLINGTSNIPLARGGDANNNQCWRLTFNTDKTLNFRNGINNAIITTPPLVDGTAVRAEWLVQGNTNGVARLLLFNLNETLPYYDSGEVFDNFTGGVYNVRFGITNATTNVTSALDDIGWSDVKWLGPAQTDILPVGIPSSATIGNNVTGKLINSSGIISNQKFGNVSTSTNQTVSISGISPSNVFGAALTEYEIRATGFTNDPVGNSQVYYQQVIKAISSISSFGNAVVLSTATLTPTSLDTTSKFGAATLAPQSTISPAAITSNQHFGFEIVQTTYSITPSFISTVNSLGNASLYLLFSALAISTENRIGSLVTARGANANYIDSNQNVGTISVTTNSSIISFSVVDNTKFGTPSVTTTITTQPGSVQSTSSVPPVVTGLQLSAKAITTSQSFGNIATSIIDLINSISTSQVVPSPVVMSTYNVALQGIESSQSLGSIATTSGTLLSVSGIPSASVVGNSSESQALLMAGVPSTSYVSPAHSVQQIAVNSIASSDSIASPQVTSYLILQPKALPVSGAFGNIATALSVTITPNGITSNAAVGSSQGATSILSVNGIETKQSLGDSKFAQIILPYKIDSKEKFGSPTNTPGSVTLNVNGIRTTQEVSNIADIGSTNTIRPFGVRSLAYAGAKISVHYQASVDATFGAEGVIFSAQNTETTNSNFEDDLNIIFRTTE